MKLELVSTHLPLVPHICASELDQTSMKLDQNTKLFIHENAFENAICEMAAILSRWDELNSFRSRQRIWKCRLQNGGLLFRLYCVNATLLSLFDIVAGCAFDCEILLSLAQTNAYRRANMPYDKGHIVMQWPRSFGQLLTFPIRLKTVDPLSCRLLWQ